jgi:hypothetical protein
VYDRDRGKAEGDALGYGYFNLDLVAEGQVLEQWVQLRNSLTGEIRVRLLVLSGTDDSFQVRSSTVPVCGPGNVFSCVVQVSLRAILVAAVLYSEFFAVQTRLSTKVSITSGANLAHVICKLHAIKVVNHFHVSLLHEIGGNSGMHLVLRCMKNLLQSMACCLVL